jgi:hypothetical protein
VDSQNRRRAATRDVDAHRRLRPTVTVESSPGRVRSHPREPFTPAGRRSRATITEALGSAPITGLRLRRSAIARTRPTALPRIRFRASGRYKRCGPPAVATEPATGRNIRYGGFVAQDETSGRTYGSS